MNQNQIVKAPMNEPATMEGIESWAGKLLKSGFLPSAIKTVEQAMMIMLVGKELGLGFTEALRSVNVIQGKPCLSAQLMLGLCFRTGQVEFSEMRESTEKRCVFVLKRKGSPAFISIFTFEEADKACFSKAWDKDKQEWKLKDNWKKQPATMLQWRAISKACRVVFPDAVSGVYTEEEIADDVVVVTDPVTQEKTASLPEPKTVEVVPEAAPVLEGESLMGWVMPGGKYKDMTLGAIFDQKTDAGARTGLKYLKWCITPEAKVNAETKSVIAQFLKEIGEE